MSPAAPWWLIPYQLHYTLPVYGSQHTALAFHPESGVLVLVLASNMFYLFDVARKCLADWSKEVRLA
jgi:hypothetical protein